MFGGAQIGGTDWGCTPGTRVDAAMSNNTVRAAVEEDGEEVLRLLRVRAILNVYDI